jgi:hypothetical protein
MPEKPPAFVVNDRRKFTAEGEIREGYVAPAPPPPAPPAFEESARLVPTPEPSAKVVTMSAPNRSTVEADDRERPGTVATELDELEPGSDELAGDNFNDESADSDFATEAAQLGPVPTAAETAAQHSAYQKSTRELDTLLQQANPGMPAQGAVTFEHVIQSFYLSAIMAMGAGTEPGQKPRIDIVGARQAIDMLAVLDEKTKGNLSAKEEKLLQTVTFEMRMMFLELTNAIARQAMQAPAPGSPGGPPRIRK